MTIKDFLRKLSEIDAFFWDLSIEELSDWYHFILNRYCN